MTFAWPAGAARLTLEGFGGLPLAVRCWGQPDDPSVVLLHNGTRSSGVWTEAAEALAAAGRYVVAPDLRGHGDSGWSTDGRYDLDAFAGDLAALLDTLPSRPVLVGASLGGLVALATIGRQGDVIASGLILVDAAPAVEEATLERLTAMIGGEDGTFDARIINAFDREDVVAGLEAVAGAIRIPTLVLRGGNDPLVGDAALSRLRAILPHAEVRDIEESGHFIVEDSLERFNAVVIEFLERAVPREPVHFETGSATRVLRDTLGCFITGITVVTTIDEDGAPAGCTVNSFASVSLDPPLLLFSLDRRSRLLPLIEAGRPFAVNVLHIGQQPTSNLFAGGSGDRFAETSWEQWETGAPILTGSLAAFECGLEAAHEGGDHRIIIGKVVRARSEPRRDPLIYYRGRYRRLHIR